MERLLRTANALAVDHDGAILLLGMVDSFDTAVVPEFNSTEAGEDERNGDQNEEFEEVRRQMGKLLELAAKVGSKERIRGVIGVEEQFSDIVLGALDHFDCESVLLLQNEYTDQQALLSRSTIDSVVADAACDVFVENVGEIDGESAIYLPSAESPFVERMETGQIESILLAAGSGPHTALAAEAARALARASDASIEIVHLVPPDADGRRLASAREILDFASFVVQNEQSTTTAIIETPDPATEIIERSISHNVVVLGAPQEHSLSSVRLLLGTKGNHSTDGDDGIDSEE